MHQIKEMLKKMGFEIVVDEMKTTEWTENDGFFVAIKIHTIVLTTRLIVTVMNRQLFL